MNTDAYPRLRIRSLPLQKWLRRRVRHEAIYQLASGLIFLAIGVVVLAAIVAIPAVFLGKSLDLEINSRNATIVAGLFFLLLVISFLVASRNKLGVALPEQRKPDDGRFAELDRMLLMAPGQFLASFESFQKVVRLLRCDVPQVAIILLWLFDRRRKATVQEICAGLSGDASIRLLPQLRDLPGVIWLTYGHGVIILSLEMRSEMARQLHESFLPPQSPASPSWEEPAPEPEPEPETQAEREMIGYYLVMNLPPFASLEKVKLRYRQLVKIHHPDARSGRRSGVDGEEKIKQINEAYHSILEYSKTNPESFRASRRG
jgi:hypothetical protein